MSKRWQHAPNTLHAVANLLGSSGWNEAATNVIKRWWRANRMDEYRERRLDKNRRAFSAMVAEKLDERDKIVLGRYIGLLCRQHFDAGLTMGLTSRIAEGQEDEVR